MNDWAVRLQKKQETKNNLSKATNGLVTARCNFQNSKSSLPLSKTKPMLMKYSCAWSVEELLLIYNNNKEMLQLQRYIHSGSLPKKVIKRVSTCYLCCFHHCRISQQTLQVKFVQMQIWYISVDFIPKKFLTHWNCDTRTTKNFIYLNKYKIIQS